MGCQVFSLSGSVLSARSGWGILRKTRDIALVARARYAFSTVRKLLPCFLLVLLAGNASARRRDPLLDLRAAAADPLLLERLLPELTPARVARALASADKDLARAAAQLAPQLEFRLALIPELLALAGRGDPALAAQALDALSQLARGLSRVSGERDQLGEEDRDAFAVGVMALAQRADAASAVRARALEVAEDLLAAGEPGDLATLGNLTTALVADPDAEVRRAAVELLPVVNAKMQARLTALISDDPDDAVATAAAGRVCEARPTLADPSAARVRALIVLPATSASEILGMLPCLRAHGRPEDAALLKALKKSKSSEVKSLATALAFKAPGK